MHENSSGTISVMLDTVDMQPYASVDLALQRWHYIFIYQSGDAVNNRA